MATNHWNTTMIGVVTIFVLCCLHCTETQEQNNDAVECLKDEDAPKVEVNIYYCEDASKPECCEMDGEFTCCEPQATKNMKEQLMLWGPLVVIAIIVGMGCICYRKELRICEGDSLSARCKKNKKPEKKGLVSSDVIMEEIHPKPNSNFPPSHESVNTPEKVSGSPRSNESKVQGHSEEDSGRGSSLSAIMDENSPVANLLPDDFNERGKGNKSGSGKNTKNNRENEEEFPEKGESMV